MGYPKQVFARAHAELDRRRQAALAANEARAVEIAERIPEIPRIERDMAATAASLTRLVIASPQKAEEALASLREKSLSLQKRREALLVQAGYPADYLAERKACNICGGSGFAGMDMCGCLRSILQKEAYAALSAVSQAGACVFENFSLDMYPDTSPPTGGTTPRAQMSGVFSACKRYAAEFSLSSGNLLMLGQTGLGKTHLSLAIANAVTAAGFGVVYTSVQKLTDRLETTKFSYAADAKAQYAQDMENVLQCDLLILDDLGAEFITQFSNSVLYNIVNSRLVEARPTIINTNLDPGAIEAKYSQRMLSRLMGGYLVLKFSGKDIRVEKKMRRPRP